MYPSTPVLASSDSNMCNSQMQINTFQLHSETHPTVKTEASSSQQAQKFQCHFRQGNELSFGEDEAIKAKIIAHPQYSSLLQAYIDCQKVKIKELEIKQLKNVTCTR